MLEVGFVLEGPMSAIVDPASDRLVIQVARARERVGASDTGRMFADIELVGSLAPVLGAITEVSRDSLDRLSRRSCRLASLAFDRDAVHQDACGAARPSRSRVIDRKRLVRALDRRGISDWVIVQHDQTVATASDQPALRRSERRVIWHVTVHHDAPKGRGSAHVTIDASDADPTTIVTDALALAQSSIGPAWSSPPLAAPARVAIADSKLADRDVLEVATGLVGSIAKPANTAVTSTATVLREKVSVIARAGLRSEWPATSIRIAALVAAPSSSILVEREARRLADLDIDAAVSDAAGNLGDLAAATAPTPGPCAVVLRPEAMLHGGLGVWQAFVSQADAVVERQGLTRYREKAPIAPGAAALADPLTVRSDGAVDFGLLSAPVGDDGDAIRAFYLVEKGIAAGLGLAPREAALRGRDPNGGVRNLDVNTGAWSGAIDATAGRVVEILRLRSLTIDPYTGDASLEIALGIDHPSMRPFTGGSLRLDLIDALARAHRSGGIKLTRGAYTGPDAVLLEHGELFG